MNPVLWMLVITLVAVSLARYFVQRGELRKARSTAVAVMMVATAALQPHQVPPVEPPPPDERKRTPSPPFGTPVACSPDAGVDGAASMLAADPDTRMAGEPTAVDYEASDTFQPGRPVARQLPR